MSKICNKKHTHMEEKQHSNSQQLSCIHHQLRRIEQYIIKSKKDD